MKNSVRAILVLLVIASISLNIWQANVIRPLPPRGGNSINSAIETGENNKNSLRIATYNMRGAKGIDDIRDIKRTATALQGFDLIGLNEVRGKTLLSSSSQVEKLGEILKMGWLFLPTQERYFKESFGNGLLSSLPVDIWYREPLISEFGNNTSSSYRNLSTIQFNFNDKLITLLLTHLDFNVVRKIQLSYVINEFAKYKHCILIGDLNSRREDPALIGLLNKDTTIDAINLALGPRDTPDRIDWIIVKGFKVIDGGYTPPGVSDHPLYWVELEISPLKAEPKPAGQ
jgi:endonuclease/exonuclease/phosphatase family metal-dependent hydrolase